LLFLLLEDLEVAPLVDFVPGALVAVFEVEAWEVE
jgi:hypothetical protein